MYEFSCAGPVNLEARMGGGTVEIQATGTPEEGVGIDVQPYGDSEAAAEAAARTRVEMRGDTVVITAPEASGWILRRSPKIQVVARLPRDSSVRLRIASADVTCHGRYAGIRVNSAAGDVYAEHVTGDLTVAGASADLRVVRVDGRLSVSNASGDTSAQQVAGPVDVKTASGDVEIEEAGGDVRATTASGTIRLGTVRRGTVSVRSVSGDVSVGVAAGTGVWLDLNSLSGQTHSDLAPSDAPPGGHDLTIQARAVSGDVEVRRVNLPTAA
jgi:DUF4097 and DUF4098 domain-containing protein YvlB